MAPAARRAGAGWAALPAGLGLALAAGAWLPPVAAAPALAASFRVAGLALVLWSVGLALRAAATGRPLRLRLAPARVHGVQAAVHGLLYLGWGLHWPQVAAHAPHVAAQVVFYYAFDLLLAWSRRDEARLGFGPLPIVLSTNLFLWFRDDFFVWQFAMLAAGAAGKEWVRWRRAGARTHVFNPSSLPLSVVCVALWAGGADGVTWARDIAVTQGAVPYAYLGIFALGLVVQSLFAVTLVTLGSVATLYALNLAWTAATGVYAWTDVGIPVAVFLGCHFLVTDPATSPRSPLGRLAFGALYGAAVFALYLLLRETGGPAWYDKLLCVPLLNLAVRRLDGLGEGRRLRAPRLGAANLAHVAALAGLFAWLSATDFLGRDHPGRSLAFWERACAEARFGACESWLDLLDEACHEGERERCVDVAGLMESGDGVERDLADAGYHLALACQDGVGAACARLPGFLSRGGEDALARSCREGDGLSCQVLGAVLSGGLGVPAQPDRARALLGRACELGVAEGCEAAGGERDDGVG